MEDRTMQELRLHADVLRGEGAQSPLVQIREKELEIRGRVMEAQKESEKIVAEARTRAGKLIEEATRKADSEASAAHDAGVAAIDDEVETLSKEQAKETEAMIKASKARLDTAVERVLKAVIP